MPLEKQSTITKLRVESSFWPLSLPTQASNLSISTPLSLMALTGGLKELQERMYRLNDKDYVWAFLSMLEFHKPKLNRRVDENGNDTKEITFVLQNLNVPQPASLPVQSPDIKIVEQAESVTPIVSDSQGDNIMPNRTSIPIE